MKHIGIFSNSGDVQTALNEETLVNPYVALVSGALDYDTLEQQSCEERGLCGDDPTDCHECTCEEQYSDPADICVNCEGGYYWGGECHDGPEPDPCEGYESQEECDCVQQGGTWEGSECVMPSEPAEGTCEEQGLCDDGEGGCFPCPGPCDEYEPGSDEQLECECVQQGGSWEGSECVMPSEPAEGTCEEQGLCDDGEGGCFPCPGPCDEYEPGSDEQLECECIQQGGTWEGSECHMPSDE